MSKKKDSDWGTKTDILIYLSNDKKSRTGIIEHIKQKKKIKENRGLDKHISELCHDELIIKETKEKGFSVYYYLNPEYEAFKRIINKCFEKNKGLEIMESKYFQIQVEQAVYLGMLSDYLVSIVDRFKFLWETGKNDTLKVNPEIKDLKIEEKLESAHREAKDSLNKESIDVSDEDKAQGNETFTYKEIETINDDIRKSIGSKNGNFAFYQEMIDILKSSPSALKYLIDTILKENSSHSALEYLINSIYKKNISDYIFPIDLELPLAILRSFITIDVFVKNEYVKTEYAKRLSSKYKISSNKEVKINSNNGNLP
jgi:hypothetical protein